MSLPLLALVLAAPTPEVAPPPRLITPAALLAAAAREFDAIEEGFRAELRRAAHDMPAVSAANDKYRRDCHAWKDRTLPLIREHSAEPAAVDAILALSRAWYLEKPVLQVLRDHHFADPRVGWLVYSLAQSEDRDQRGFAEDVAARHPDRRVRAQATLDLGHMDRVYLVDAMRSRPSFGGRLGPPDMLRKRAAEYLGRVVKEYADVQTGDGESFGELAEAELAGLENVGRLEVGKVAPDIAGHDLDGNPLRMTAASGRVTVLVFWGTWCGPCMRLVSREVALADKYRDKPFAMFGVNGGDERPKAKKAVAEKKMTWPSFHSGSKTRSGIAAVWNVEGWPTVYVIDPTGVIRYKGHGDGLETAVEECVAKAEATKSGGR